MHSAMVTLELPQMMGMASLGRKEVDVSLCLIRVGLIYSRSRVGDVEEYKFTHTDLVRWSR